MYEIQLVCMNFCINNTMINVTFRNTCKLYLIYYFKYLICLWFLIILYEHCYNEINIVILMFLKIKIKKYSISLLNNYEMFFIKHIL